MLKNNILLLIFVLLPTLLLAESEIHEIYIGEREPIISPIPQYDPEINSYPNPFNDDKKILTIDKSNYIKLNDCFKFGYDLLDKELNPLIRFNTFDECIKCVDRLSK